MHNLDLYTPDGHSLSYVAYLLADNNNLSVKVAKYAGTDKCDLIENEEYGFCSLVKATHSVLGKLNIENRTLTRITGAAEREQHRLLDERALREALINAMVHNDYSAEVMPVVEIYADRLCITSYGGLINGLSVDECLAGRSMPRNRELMRVFRDLELVEQLGSGMARILRSYEPGIFHFSENFMEVRFPFSAGAASGAESTPQVTPQVAELLELLRQHGELGTLDIAKRLDLKNRKHVRTAYINPALEQGLIEYTIPDKPSSRLQKYRLKSKQ